MAVSYCIAFHHFHRGSRGTNNLRETLRIDNTTVIYTHHRLVMGLGVALLDL
jgi:hypothetical protein